VAQRPTKRLLTLGTHLYDDLCCMLKREIVAETEARLDGPQNEIGEGANMLKDADHVVCGDGGGVEKMGSEEH
jgi:hypothetical protein